MGNLNSNIENNKLSCITEIKIRFCEVDSIKVVWHGNYVKYLEDGREDFGEKFGLQYLKIFENGFTAPVVDMRLQFKQSISVAESIIVETNYIPTKAAKIIFNYNIYKHLSQRYDGLGFIVNVYKNCAFHFTRTVKTGKMFTVF